MKSGILKKIIAVAMSATMLFSVTACNKKSDKQEQEAINTKEMVYEGTEFKLKGIDGDISDFYVKGDKIYLLTYEWLQIEEVEGNSSEEDKQNEDTSGESNGEEKAEDTSEEGNSTEQDKDSTSEEEQEENAESTTKTHLYVSDIEGNDIKEIPLPKIPDNEYLNFLFECSDDNVQYILSSYDEKTEKSSYYVVKLDAQGKEVIKEDITKTLNISDETYIGKVMADDKGRMLILTQNSVYVLDENYKLLSEIKSENYLEGMAKTKDGKIICASNANEGAQVQILDVDQKKWGESYPLNIQYISDFEAVMNGDEYDFYYKDDSGIYGYDIKTKKNTKLMDYLASDLDTSTLYKILPFEKNRFIAVSYAQETPGLVIYNKVDSAKIADKQTITIGAMYINDSVKKAALDFNKKSEEYRIEIKDYSNEEDPETKMNADILAGNVPDIICLSSLPTQQYVSKGILEDLTPYFDKDAEISTSDIIDSVLKAMQVDGKLYYVTPSFMISTLVGSSKDVGTEAGWNFEEMKKLLNEKGEKVRPFYAEEKSYILYSFLGYNLSDFVDWQTGECSFDGQEFKDILELANQGKDEEAVQYEDSPSMPSLIKDGTVLFTEGTISLEEIQVYKKMFDGDITFIGYPNEEKNGSYFSIYNNLGMYSKSKVKDGAWEFLRTFMTKEYQGNTEFFEETPTRKDCFEMMIKARMTTEKYVDEFGNEISPMESEYGFEDLEVKIKPSSQEEVDMYRELINNTTKIGEYNDSIMEIIQEETKAYFAGDKNVDETVSVIQNRVKTYVNENR